MLCSSLIASGMAGYPMDYIDGRYLTAFQRVRGTWSMATYFDDLETRRTSPNGLFGVKVKPHQIEHTFGLAQHDAHQFIRSFDRFIRIYRRDKLGQAISLMLAQESSVWVGDAPDAQRGPDRRDPSDDLNNVARSLALVAQEDHAWRTIIRELRLTTLDIAYEDLIADPSKELLRVFEWLGVDVTPTKIPLPKIVHQPSGSDAIKHAFLREVGFNSLALLPARASRDRQGWTTSGAATDRRHGSPV